MVWRQPRQGRGNVYDRRRRRAWLIETYKISPAMVECYHCQQRMRASGPWEVDRFPIPGRDGGTYRRDNIVISCRDCNRGKGKRRDGKGARPRQRNDQCGTGSGTGRRENGMAVW